MDNTFQIFIARISSRQKVVKRNSREFMTETDSRDLPPCELGNGQIYYANTLCKPWQEANRPSKEGLGPWSLSPSRKTDHSGQTYLTETQLSYFQVDDWNETAQRQTRSNGATSWGIRREVGGAHHCWWKGRCFANPKAVVKATAKQRQTFLVISTMGEE